MRVLFLTQTGPLGPASRYRVYQLLPWLRQAGIKCEVSPAIDDALYARAYLNPDGRRLRREALRAIWKTRSDDLRRLDRFDAVFIQKCVLAGASAFFETAIAEEKPFVLDLDDASWLPRQGGWWLARLLHREASVQKVVRCAAAVIAGNQFLADYARQFNPSVTVIPSSIELSRYRNPASLPSSRPPTVGWIGSGSTLSYLKPLKPVFETLGIKPRVIGSGDPATLGFDVEFRQWRLETEVDELARIDIGIAPLPDTPWERGKCGVKILQYMACGIAVVASPVGVQPDLVRDGQTGFLARSADEWVERLRRLMSDAELRRRFGVAGRRRVEAEFSAEHAARKVAELLRDGVRQRA
jgi:glycosyltransferase involved in cell wall biosynthesis